METPIFATASELAQAIQSRQLSSEEIVRADLARMEVVNPQINAVTVLAADALKEARAADVALATGEVRGPLHGVPFTVKDTFDTAGVVSPMAQKIRRGGRLWPTPLWWIGCGAPVRSCLPRQIAPPVAAAAIRKTPSSGRRSTPMICAVRQGAAAAARPR